MYALHTRLVREEALRLGFDFCGFSRAGFLEEEAPLFEKWLKENRHGSMQYMENHFDKRLNPRLLVEDAKSVVSLLLNYYPPVTQADQHAPKVSKYAYGRDYHFVIKDKLQKLVSFIKENIGDVNARAFVDSAPVMDKAWAKRSGLGWIGKHSNLISKKNGSFFFIAELILDMEFLYDSPSADYCGSCTKCIDACPTGAIIQPYVVDGSRCISYFTIELKDAIPAEMSGRFDNWAFGCDVCQDVCPWNRFALPHKEPSFDPPEELVNMDSRQWDEITEEKFNELFKDSAVQRTGYKGLKRNLAFLRKPS